MNGWFTTMRKSLIVIISVCFIFTACNGKPLRIEPDVRNYSSYEKVEKAGANVLCSLSDINTSLLTQEDFNNRMKIDGNFNGEFNYDGIKAAYSGMWSPGSLSYVIEDSIVPNAEVQMLKTDCGYFCYPIWYIYDSNSLDFNNQLPYLAVISGHLTTSARSVSVKINLSVNSKDPERLKPIIQSIVQDINKSIQSNSGRTT